ncbi:hypothetical protein [Segetibacter aerophilus]|uniref:Uncharacterized protein n=1 Tax=Segetibacter aerophilus TaxID=670293 RepID=A0A512BBC8_9BACT|nr:hypothetical protein [Segetibacter aerophilus]GEO09279.1 hypothetical protein SAE01_17750 [Segetibacter aerophilus]
MERVGVLVNKLQEQLSQKADVQNMLVTAQLLHNELLIAVSQSSEIQNKKVSVSVPGAAVINAEALPNLSTEDLYKPVARPEPEPEPVAEPTPVPESPLPEPAPMPTPRPEPEPIPHFVEQKPWHQVFPSQEDKRSPWALDPVLEVPTLAHQQKAGYELNDTMVAEGTAASLNDKLKQNKAEMSSVLQEAPIRDLKKAISINDRHRFISELFRGDETMYERSIKTINTFHIFAEAEFWIQRELKVKLGWDTSLELVKTFDQLVKRRFS